MRQLTIFSSKFYKVVDKFYKVVVKGQLDKYNIGSCVRKARVYGCFVLISFSEDLNLKMGLVDNFCFIGGLYINCTLSAEFSCIKN